MQLSLHIVGFPLWSGYPTCTVTLKFLLKNWQSACGIVLDMAEDEVKEELHVGAHFASLELEMKHFKEQQMVTYWIRHSRKASAY